MTAIVLALSMIGGPSAPAAAQATTAEDLARVRPDVDLAAGFEPCRAPVDLYARLPDELLFALGAEDLLPSVARLAGVESGAGVTGLVVVARGTGRLAITPARASAPVDEPLEAATPSRRLNDSAFAVEDLSLLGEGAIHLSQAAPSSCASSTMRL